MVQYYVDSKQAYNNAEDNAYDEERQLTYRHQRSGSEFECHGEAGRDGRLEVHERLAGFRCRNI